MLVFVSTTNSPTVYLRGFHPEAYTEAENQRQECVNLCPNESTTVFLLGSSAKPGSQAVRREQLAGFRSAGAKEDTSVSACRCVWEGVHVKRRIGSTTNRI